MAKKKGRGTPAYRFVLKGRIHQSGYRTVGEFSKDIGVNPARISRVVCGWEIPSHPLQKKIAEKLGLSPEEMEKVL